MSRISHTTTKVELHGEGVGIPSDADLERRASELARIAGHTAVTGEDRALARAEFQDRALPDAVNEDRESMQSASRDPSEPLVNRGSQVPEYVEGDEKANLERLVLEGVEEAQHEQMLKARQRGGI